MSSLSHGGKSMLYYGLASLIGCVIGVCLTLLAVGLIWAAGLDKGEE